MKYGIRPDTGGAGKFRGGCGVYRQYVLDEPAKLYLWFERSVTPAWGLFGGGEAIGPDVVINEGDEAERHMLKVNALRLKPGDTVTYYTGGGGGYGHPWDRDPLRVQADVYKGYVSRKGAESAYGVVLREDLSIDEKSTEERRIAMQSERT
jgi:N-methylhydantoinase B